MNERNFGVDAVVRRLNEILRMELAAAEAMHVSEMRLMLMRHPPQ